MTRQIYISLTRQVSLSASPHRWDTIKVSLRVTKSTNRYQLSKKNGVQYEIQYEDPADEASFLISLKLKKKSIGQSYTVSQILSSLIHLNRQSRQLLGNGLRAMDSELRGIGPTHVKHGSVMYTHTQFITPGGIKPRGHLYAIWSFHCIHFVIVSFSRGKAEPAAKNPSSPYGYVLNDFFFLLSSYHLPQKQ